MAPSFGFCPSPWPDIPVLQSGGSLDPFSSHFCRPTRRTCCGMGRLFRLGLREERNTAECDESDDCNLVHRNLREDCVDGRYSNAITSISTRTSFGRRPT